MTSDQRIEERGLPPRTAPGQLDIAALRSSVSDLEQQARALIRERPVVAVVTALAFGYLAARLVSRGRR